MNHIHKLCLSFVLLISATTFAAECGNSKSTDRPKAAVGKDAEEKLLNRDFAGLEVLAKAYRNPSVVTTEGLPKLSAFYSWMSDPAPPCGHDIPEQTWLDRQNLIDEWNEAVPGSAAASIAAADFQISYAWHARGNGYANEVTDEGWRLFAERTAKARSLLEQPAVMADRSPARYGLMMQIALMQSWKPKDYDKLYAEAAGKYPLYYDIYFQRKTYYSPQWNGTEGDFDKVVADAVKRTHKHIGQAMYARLHSSNSDLNQFTDGRTDWKRMKKGFQDLIAAYPDSWNRNNYAMFACRANDWATFKEQAALFGDDVKMTVWGGIGGYYWCKANANKGGAADPTKPVQYP